MCRSEKIEETVSSKTQKLKPRSLDSENVEKVKHLRYEKERRILEADWTQSVKMRGTSRCRAISVAKDLAWTKTR